MSSAVFVTGGRLRAGWRFALFAVIATLLLIAHNAVLQVIPAFASAFERLRSGSVPVLFSVVAVGSSLVLVLGLTAIAARLERRSLAAYGLPLGSAFGRRFWQGALWGVTLTTLTIGATWLLGGISFAPPSLSVVGVALYGVAWALSFVLVGIVEELLFRGYALATLGEAIGFWPAAVMLASAFGVVHLFNPGENIVGALNVVSFALFASLTLRRTGNLWFAIGVHSGWNYALTFLYGVPVSGMHAEQRLLEGTLHGPAWLTGGTVGPEGSALGFVALALALLVFAWRSGPSSPRASSPGYLASGTTG